MMKYLTNRDARRAILITLLVILVYRIGSFLTVPGINTQVLITLDNFINSEALFPLFLGGKLTIMSVFALGVIPYVTASIVVQLLEMDIVPFMAEWKENGEEGRKKRNEVIRIFALILAYIESVGIMFGLNVLTNGALIDVDPIYYLLIAIVTTAGVAILLFLADIVTERGVGNGVSVVISVSIISSLAYAVNNIYRDYIFDKAGVELLSSIVIITIAILALILLIIAVVYFVQAKRNIPINYVGQAYRGPNKNANKSFLPIKLNSAGVIPVIFASTLLALPRILSSFAPEEFNQQVLYVLDVLFNYSTSPVAMLIYMGLIFGFSLMYAFVQINPEKVSQNLERQNAYIIGIRPGQDTTDYIESILYRLTFWGGIILAFIAITPILFGNITGFTSGSTIGGTGVIIITGVTIEIIKNMNSKLSKVQYRGFL